MPSPRRARRRHTWSRRARDERGAVAPFVALMMTVFLLCAALAIDIGMQRVGRTDMQSLADVVALDLSRELSAGKTRAALQSSMDAKAAQSRSRNTDTLGETPTLGVELGEILADGSFRLVATTQVPTAVRVTATTDVGMAFAGITGVQEGEVSRSAVAAATSFACYRLGSWAASINTTRSVLLNPVLQQMSQMTGAFTNGGVVRALDYRALAAASVDLNALALRLGVASAEALATSTVRLRALYLGIAALAQPRNSTAVTALDALAAATSTTTSVSMGKVLAVAAGSSSLATAHANALDLVGGTISVLNGTNAADVYLGATLPGLANAGLRFSLMEAPRQYCGPAGATGIGTQQLTARVGGQLSPTTVNFVPPGISGLLRNVASAQITAENYATFDFTVAGAQSWLREINCQGSSKSVRIDVENKLATVTFETPLRAVVKADLLNGLLFSSAHIAINAGVKVTAVIGTSGVRSVSITVPPQSFDTPIETGSSQVTVTSTTRTYANVTANVALLGGLLGANISLTTAQQSQILDSVLSSGLTGLIGATGPGSLSATVFEPVLALLGARLGGSDVILDSKPELTCARPKLVG